MSVCVNEPTRDDQISWSDKNERWMIPYLDALELIRLESPDFVRFLLDNLGLVQRLYCHYFIFNTQSYAQLAFKDTLSPISINVLQRFCILEFLS